MKLLLQLNFLIFVITSSHSSISDICFLQNVIKIKEKNLVYFVHIFEKY